MENGPDKRRFDVSARNCSFCSPNAPPVMKMKRRPSPGGRRATSDWSALPVTLGVMGSPA